MMENNPGFRCMSEFMQGLYARHPIRGSVGGTEESIMRITAETLYDCHRVFYHPSNMILCCVGDIEPDAVADIAREILTNEPGEAPERDYGEPEDVLPAETYRECFMPVASPLFFFGAKLRPEEKGRARLRQQLLAELSMDAVAGEASPFYTGLYGKGILNRRFSKGVLFGADTRTVAMEGESREPEKVLEALSDAVNGIACSGLDEAYFSRCKKAFYGAELSALDSFGTIASALIRGQFDGWNVLDEYALLETLTAEDAAAFLCENLTPERIAMSVVRPL